LLNAPSHLLLLLQLLPFPFRPVSQSRSITLRPETSAMVTLPVQRLPPDQVRGVPLALTLAQLGKVVGLPPTPKSTFARTWTSQSPLSRK